MISYLLIAPSFILSRLENVMCPIIKSRNRMIMTKVGDFRHILEK